MLTITIENVINKIFTGEQQKHALDFVAHVRELGLPFKEYDAEQKTYDFSIEYKNEKLCFIYQAVRKHRTLERQRRSGKKEVEEVVHASTNRLAPNILTALLRL